MVQQANFELGSNQFEMPSIKYTAREISFPGAVIRPERKRAGNIIVMEKMNNNDVAKANDGIFDGSPSPTKAWKKISKYISSKNPDDINVKDLYESRLMKE